MRGSRAPSDDEFEQFVADVWPSLYRTAYLMVGDHGLAEDLAQTALASTHAHWGRIRERAAAPAYARRIVVTTATSWFRRRGFRGEVPTEDVGEPAGGGPRGASSDPGAIDDVALRLDLVHHLQALPARQRAVVVLRFYDDLSVAEVAEVLQISEGTVKSQTSHALHKLRASLGTPDLTVRESSHA